jgi:hypothetical protein
VLQHRRWIIISVVIDTTTHRFFLRGLCFRFHLHGAVLCTNRFLCIHTLVIVHHFHHNFLHLRSLIVGKLLHSCYTSTYTTSPPLPPTHRGCIFIIHHMQLPGHSHCRVPTLHTHISCLYQVLMHVSVTLEALTQVCINWWHTKLTITWLHTCITN